MTIFNEKEMTTEEDVKYVNSMLRAFHAEHDDKIKDDPLLGKGLDYHLNLLKVNEKSEVSTALEWEMDRCKQRLQKVLSRTDISLMEMLRDYKMERSLKSMRKLTIFGKDKKDELDFEWPLEK